MELDLRGNDVGVVITQLKQLQQHVPERLQTDNGSEFISKALDKWRMKMASRWTSPGRESRRTMR